MDTAIIAAAAAVLVSLITAVAGLLNARNDREQALAEAELLERLERVELGSKEGRLIRSVLNKRLVMWDKRSQGDLEARAWRAMWPLVSITGILAIALFLIRPEFLFRSATTIELLGILVAAMIVVCASLAVISISIYLVTTVRRRMTSSPTSEDDEDTTR